MGLLLLPPGVAFACSCDSFMDSWIHGWMDARRLSEELFHEIDKHKKGRVVCVNFLDFDFFLGTSLIVTFLKEDNCFSSTPPSTIIDIMVISIICTHIVGGGRELSP